MGGFESTRFNFFRSKLASGADHETAPLGTEEIESGAFETPLENPANITVELANSDPAGSVIVTPEEAWFNEREQSVVCQTAPEANDPEPVTKSVHFEEETLPEAGAFQLLPLDKKRSLQKSEIVRPSRTRPS